MTQRSRLVRSILVGLIVMMVGLTGCGDRPGPSSQASTPRAAARRVVERVVEVSPPAVIQELRRDLDQYHPQVAIVSPRAGQVLDDNTVSVQFQVQDLPTFQDEDLGMGPHLHVIVDNQPYIAIYDPSEPLILEDLEPGTHTIRAFASRPWHESFKNEGAYAQVTFHVFTQTPTNNPQADQPLLTYSRPKGTYGAEPIMLDFYLANTPLHFVAQENPEDDIIDWKIRCTINGQSFTFDNWEPIYLTGFVPGKNWIQLELLNEANRPIANAFNNTARLITYEPGGDDTLSKLVRGDLTAKEARRIVDPTYNPELEAAPEDEAAPEEATTVEPEEAVPAAEPVPDVDEQPETPVAPQETDVPEVDAGPATPVAPEAVPDVNEQPETPVTSEAVPAVNEQPETPAAPDEVPEVGEQPETPAAAEESLESSEESSPEKSSLEESAAEVTTSTKAADDQNSVLPAKPGSTSRPKSSLAPEATPEPGMIPEIVPDEVLTPDPPSEEDEAIAPPSPPAVHSPTEQSDETVPTIDETDVEPPAAGSITPAPASPPNELRQRTKILDRFLKRSPQPEESISPGTGGATLALPSELNAPIETAPAPATPDSTDDISDDLSVPEREAAVHQQE